MMISGGQSKNDRYYSPCNTILAGTEKDPATGCLVRHDSPAMTEGHL